MNTRLQWVDATKGLGMFLVFWGHLLEKGFFGPALIHDVYKCIYAFHMPLFFLLAGFFLRPVGFSSLLQFLLQKIRTRLVPVLFFVVLMIPLWLWPKPASWGIASDPDVLQGLWNLLDGKPSANWVCWFLICLMVVELAASQLGWLVRNRWVLLAGLPVIYAAGYLATVNLSELAAFFHVVPNWWFIQEAVLCLFFYLCGYGFFHYLNVLLPGDIINKSVIQLVVMLSILLLTFNLNYSDNLGTVNLSGGEHGHWFWFMVSALSGSMALIHLGRLVERIPLLQLIGMHTLPLLGLNGIFLHFLNAPLWTLVTATTSNLALLLPLSATVALLCLLVSLPFAMALNRWLPWFVGK